MRSSSPTRIRTSTQRLPTCANPHQFCANLNSLSPGISKENDSGSKYTGVLSLTQKTAFQKRRSEHRNAPIKSQSRTC